MAIFYYAGSSHFCAFLPLLSCKSLDDAPWCLPTEKGHSDWRNSLLQHLTSLLLLCREGVSARALLQKSSTGQQSFLASE